MTVELRYAGVPFIGFLAVHYWFVVAEGGERHRWEVWQSAGAGGSSVGHLQRDLKAPFCSRYYPWPGPNSNTFVAWVLAQAGVEHRLGWRALGSNYRRKA